MRSSGWPSVSRTDDRDTLQTYNKSAALFLYCPGKEDDRVKDPNVRVSIDVDGCCILSSKGSVSTLAQKQIEDVSVHSCQGGLHRRAPHFDCNDGIENSHCGLERGENRVLIR